MRKTRPDLLHLQRLVRARVCADCPHRSGGIPNCDTARSCEAACPLFAYLPTIHQVAGQTDPMVGHPMHLVRKLLRRVGRLRTAHGDVAAKHARRVSHIVAELFGH